MLTRELIIFFLILIIAGRLYSQSTISKTEESKANEEASQGNAKKEDTHPDEDFFKMEESIASPTRVKEITASRTKERLLEAPASMMIITEDDIRKRGYTSIDEIFYDLPGFDVSFSNGTHYANIYQRGYRTPFTQRILFMINGIIDNTLYTQIAEFSRQYPLTNVKRIEVVYGPASAVYGPNAFQGVVNIITKDGKNQNKPLEGKINFQVGQNNTYSTDASANVRNGDFYASASGRVFRSDEPDLSKRGGYKITTG